VLEIVQRAGGLELGALLPELQREHPEFTTFLVAQSIAQLYRRGLLRMRETIKRIAGEAIHTAVVFAAA
jgi:hypothetical protein